MFTTNIYKENTREEKAMKNNLVILKNETNTKIYKYILYYEYNLTVKYDIAMINKTAIKYHINCFFKEDGLSFKITCTTDEDTFNKFFEEVIENIHSSIYIKKRKEIKKFDIFNWRLSRKIF